MSTVDTRRHPRSEDAVKEGIPILKYPIVIERAKGNYSAYVPDLPGCVTVGDTIEETKRNMVEAIQLHLQGMIEDGEEVEVPHAVAVEFLDVPAPALGSKRGQ